MKIAVLGINYYPEITGIGAYTAEMCEYLAAKGHTIDVFTGFPYYPFGEEFSGWYKECNLKPYSLFAKEKYNGVTIYRTGLYKPKKPNVFKRIFHELFLHAMLEVVVYKFKV
jgi:colanic acid biosynthesis glycosyl transferase WcaI